MSNKITFTILSISLLTVLAGAAVAPALGAIQQHFSDQPMLYVKLIVSIPSLFIILVNLLFPKVCKYLRTRTIALIGLALYVVCGVGAFLVDEIHALLVVRAVFGVSVGLMMPLSTGLLAYYFPPEKIAKLMGLSSGMNQFGGVVSTFLAGYLSTVQWNYAFFVYALGLIVIVLVLLYLPNEKLNPGQAYRHEVNMVEPGNSEDEAKQLARSEGLLYMIRRFHPSVVGMLFNMGLFFVFATNFAIIERDMFQELTVTLLMVLTDVMAFAAGIMFGRLMGIFPVQMKYIAPVLYFVAFGLLAFGGCRAATVVGIVLIGFANGLEIPYINTIGSIKGGKDSVTTVMPLISAALYLGQFISPVIVGALSDAAFSDDMRGPYKIGIFFSVLFFIQVVCTRHFQSLPPRK